VCCIKSVIDLTLVAMPQSYSVSNAIKAHNCTLSYSWRFVAKHQNLQ